MTVSPRTPESWSPEYAAAVARRRAMGLDPSIKTVQDWRRAADASPTFPTPANVKITPTEIPRAPVPQLDESSTASGSLPAEWVEPVDAAPDAPVLLYAHGGWYCIGSPRTHRAITTNMAARGVRVLSLDYRLADENPFPAPLVDAISAFRYVLGQGIPASRIFLGGNSAGGNLTLVTAIYLRDQTTLPQLAGLLPIGPWTDLTCSSPTMHLGDEFEADTIARGPEGTAMVTKAYCPDISKRSHPLVSPLFDDPVPGKPLPPTLALYSTLDRLFGEDAAYALLRNDAGENVSVDVYVEQVHVFQNAPDLPQSQICFDRMSSFITSVSSGPALPAAAAELKVILPDGSVMPADAYGGFRLFRSELAGWTARAGLREKGKGDEKALERYDRAMSGPVGA
ncbi:hypothetical protein M427DRAFT_50800 [Gonapodya prolifera JEL478]|uniref:Alpha/beta hydrolase fold-3 domain-containing protein n=1 Tax=Gonapodya prolifera (strain JEL478) TaxID=1344416 RepID=A0A139B181_GONPJ|nr:hypothetical protein M427DRAFT_50800 [Gonapodya prolifera JEL478]|eukprot:KXS22485.1 hypothetical protein M427DRAFT_50800 [Gonapodya prolifera JEL478]